MQILFTKLLIPPLRSRLVLRSRLIQKLDRGLECGFVLLSAPAGYGKSTLLNAWINTLNVPAAWYTVDEGDNDPARFFAYLLTALKEIDPTMLDLLETGDPSAPPETLLTPLINRLSQVKTHFLLVLDDFHLIQNQGVHQVIRFLLEHRPAALTLVIATRADPPLPLSKLRASARLVEIRLADLRFTTDEAADFFQTTMGLVLPTEAVARITARTEGWIAGMQIAALSIQNNEDLGGFITSLTGSHHQIFDYLLEETLDRQPAEIRRFLLETSVLETLCAPLCDTVLAGEEGAAPDRRSAAVLDEMEHANLFVYPLDAGRTWYRYHSLFAGLLQSFLEQENPEKVPQLHIRASAWFESQGQMSQAIHHALAAKDWERVLRLISANVFALLEQNELPNVARQLENPASNRNHSRPWLWIARAWLAAYTGQLDRVEDFLTMIADEIRSVHNPEDQRKLSGHLAAVRAYTSWIDAKWEEASEAARNALEWLPATDTLMRCQSASVLGLSLENLAASGEAFEQAIAYARELQVSHVTVFAQDCRAYQILKQGKLHEAYAACREAIQSVQASGTQQSSPSLSHVYSTLCDIQWEWDQLADALESANKAVALARRWQQVDALRQAYTVQGNIRFETGDIEGARESLRQAWQVAHRTSAWFEEITTLQEVGWHLALNDVEAAQKRLAQAQIDIDDVSKNYHSYMMPFAFARVYIGQKRYPEALALLEKIIEEMEKRDAFYDLVGVLACQAVAYESIKEYELAMASLGRSLNLAAKEGYLRSFSSGQVPTLPLITLLRKARAKGILPDYVEKLLKFLEKPTLSDQEMPKIPVRLVEPLTDREVDVLKLLSQGCPNKKIAERLVVAEETIRTHLKNIYGKMNVHNRTEAIHMARELELL